jgi:hypothetical protein
VTNGAGGPNSTLITLVIVAIVVVRFLFRELRARTVRVRTLWIRPGVLIVLTLLAFAGAFAIPGVNVAVACSSILVGAVLGVVTGALVVRSTTFAPANERGAVIARGSAVTVVIWIVAILLRFAARYAFAGTGAGPAAQYELNVGLIGLVAAAFVVVALGFHRAIDRLAPETGSLSPRR